VRLIQEARKNSGLEVSDRIELWWTGADADGADQMRTALTEHAESLAAEVLAVTVHAQEPGVGPGLEGPAGFRFWLTRATA
jgi:isoleucyl-tRNA synthetase